MSMMDQQDAGSGGGTGMSAMEHLTIALEHAQAAMVSEQDPQDSHAVAKVIAQLYAITAGRQKEQDTMLGNPGIARALRRS